MLASEGNRVRGGDRYPATLRSPKPPDGIITLEFSRDWCEWKKTVKRLYPDKFYWHDQGMWVRTPDGEVGQITEYTYFPTSDTFYITVLIKSRMISFTDPHVLEVVPEPVKQTWSNSAI